MFKGCKERKGLLVFRVPQELLDPREQQGPQEPKASKVGKVCRVRLVFRVPKV